MVLRLFFLSIFLLLFTNCKEAIPNLSEAKSKVKDYYESGKFDGELLSIVNDVIEKLKTVKVNDSSAAVFDVDETVLSNFAYTKGIGFGYTRSTWREWLMKAKAKAILPVKKLYDYLVRRKVHIIFLTGRTAETREATFSNLLNEGYTVFDTLICRLPEEKDMNTERYKTAKRKMLISGGMKIILNIGDQKSDINGGLALLQIKIPNYLYKLE